MRIRNNFHYIGRDFKSPQSRASLAYGAILVLVIVFVLVQYLFAVAGDLPVIKEAVNHVIVNG